VGVALTNLLKIREISIKDLEGKILVVDGQNMLYQFLTTIRQQDGSLLTDSHGRVTSHLIGLISRLTNFLSKKLKIIFVFDGKVPDLKHKELQRRKGIKINAQKKYEEASQKEDLEEMKKYASRTTRLTKDMVNEAIELLRAMGIPVVQAPSEGEAQAAHMVAKGDAYAIVSQDADSLLFGATRVIRNLNVSGRRKVGATYKNISPEMIELSENLNNLGIDRNQLMLLSVLVGTDYNVGGVKGIGPKKALKLVHEFKEADKIFAEVKWEFDVSWQEVYDTLRNIPTTDNYKLRWNNFDKEKIKEILVDKHDFSADRINSLFEKLEKVADDNKQKSIFEF
jgi:flap endonuclease-1